MIKSYEKLKYSAKRGNHAENYSHTYKQNNLASQNLLALPGAMLPSQASGYFNRTVMSASTQNRGLQKRGRMPVTLF
jgi:hypothetical protein